MADQQASVQRNQHVYLKALQKHDPKSPVSQAWTCKDYLPEYRPGVPSIHTRAIPLFEVASVRIYNDQYNEFSSIQIYGTIVLIDDYGNEFYILDCKHRNDAKTLMLGPTTPPFVILQSCFQPRGVSSKFCLLFQLKRRLDGAGEEDIVIMDDYKHMDCTNEVLYDKPQRHVFHSDDSQSAIIVEATIFRCALLAEVGIIVEKTGKDQSGVAEITGDIAALTRGLSDDMSPNVRTLLDVSREKFEFGNYTPLSTLVVPAYSSLKIQGQVSVNGEDLGSVMIFEPYTESNLFHEKQIGRRPYRIRVIVYWKQGATNLPEAKILEYYAKTSETPLTNLRPTSKLLESEKTFYIQPSVRQYMMNLKWDVDDFPTELLEIFSISVCAFDQGDSIFSPRGKVKCYDSTKCLCIFDSDTEGVSTSGDKLVPDLGRGFVGSYLGITTELMDNQGREISFGSATYDFYTIGTWRDKRICSVIRGQHGFAAVHYTIFTDAVLAKLSFEVFCKFESGDAGCKVHGSINTWYSNFDYSSHYAKKYFRSTLFEKQKCDAVKLTGGEKIPLSKSAVAVPIYGSLIVEIIVYAQIGRHRERLYIKEMFSPAEDHHAIAKSRFGKNFDLAMNVDWVRSLI